jgi:hypothetical protein
VPNGGTTGQVLKKQSNTDQDTVWDDDDTGTGVPPGGTTGQVLTKQSNADGDADWETPSGGPGSVAWGAITGTLSAQTDLQTALDTKAAKSANLSDLANAVTAFGNIKQAATDSATGVVELATVAESGTGTDTSRAVTPAGLFPAKIDAASASTTDLGAVASPVIRITGTTTITAFGTVASGIRKEVYFEGSLSLEHSAALSLPGSRDILTRAGDSLLALSLGSGNWVVLRYNRAIAPEWDAEVSKTADQTVTNDTTLTNDSDLVLPMEANTGYLFELIILYTGNDATGDYKWALAYPTVADGQNVWGFPVIWNTAANGLTNSSAGAGTALFPASGQQVGVDPNIIMMQWIRFFIYNQTAGNMQYQFANFAASSGRTSITKAGSIMRMKRLTLP